jgi:hypothetical protein
MYGRPQAYSSWQMLEEETVTTHVKLFILELRTKRLTILDKPVNNILVKISNAPHYPELNLKLHAKSK